MRNKNLSKNLPGIISTKNPLPEPEVRPEMEYVTLAYITESPTCTFLSASEPSSVEGVLIGEIKAGRDRRCLNVSHIYPNLIIKKTLEKRESTIFNDKRLASLWYLNRKNKKAIEFSALGRFPKDYAETLIDIVQEYFKNGKLIYVNDSIVEKKMMNTTEVIYATMINTSDLREYYQKIVLRDSNSVFV